MVVRFVALTALVLSVSCTNFFDSYFPNSLEYLQSQANLQADVGGKTLVSVHMQLLPATAAHSSDILAVVADTTDGVQTALFYDSSMKKLVSYKRTDLETLVGSTAFSLYPIAQDSAGLSLGAVRFGITGSKPQAAAGLMSPWPMYLTPGNGTGSGSFLQYQSVYYEDMAGLLEFPSVFFGGGVNVAAPGTLGQNETMTSLPPSTTTPITQIGTNALNNASFLGVATWNLKYYLLYSSNSSAYVATLDQADPTTWTSATVASIQPSSGSNGLNTNQGWVTATAAILASDSDGGSFLHAFSLSGKDLGSINIPSTKDNSSVAFAFHPSGQFWFLFDPANGRISKYKAWW